MQQSAEASKELMQKKPLDASTGAAVQACKAYKRQKNVFWPVTRGQCAVAHTADFIHLHYRHLEGCWSTHVRMGWCLGMEMCTC